MNGRACARASPQGFFKFAGRPCLGSFIGQFGKGFHLILGKHVYCLPRFLVELNALVRHHS